MGGRSQGNQTLCEADIFARARDCNDVLTQKQAKKLSILSPKRPK